MANRDEVLDAIREAHQAGMQPSVVQRKLAAGTLGDLSRPIDMSPRSFFRKWSTVRREQARGQDPAGEDPRLAAAYREMELTDRLLAEGFDDEQIAKRLCADVGEEQTDNRIGRFAHSVRSRREHTTIERLAAEGRSDEEIAAEVGGAWTAAGIHRHRKKLEGWRDRRRPDPENGDR